MELRLEKRWIVWLIWLLVFPTGLFLSTFLPSFFDSHHYTTLASLLLLTIIISLLPIVMNGSPVFFINGISLLVFLLFGLFSEIIITQIGLLLMSLTFKYAKEDFYKIAINSMMFLFISFISTAGYYVTGGNHAPVSITEMSTILPIVVYFVLGVASNQIFIASLYKILGNNKKWVLTFKEFLAELGSESYVFATSVTIYILYYQMGISSLIQAIVIYAGLVFVFKLLYSSNVMNAYLEKAAAIGQELSLLYNKDEILELYSKRIFDLVEADWTYVYLINNKQLTLECKVERGEPSFMPKNIFYEEDAIFKQLLATLKSFVLRNRKQIKSYSSLLLHEKMVSSLIVPLINNRTIIGVVIVGTKKKYAYEKHDIRILELLTTTLDISLKNAENYSLIKEKSEKCTLTGLYNYQALETALDFSFNGLHTKFSSISVMIVDLDKFKIVNDTYGHQAGNDVLCEFANILKEYFDSDSFVARLGGEEFAVIFYNDSSQEITRKLENFRIHIENTSFSTKNYLAHEEYPISLSITCSIGFASTDDDEFDMRSILQAADRAMYIGSKQQGRNKVSAYRNISSSFTVVSIK